MGRTDRSLFSGKPRRAAPCGAEVRRSSHDGCRRCVVSRAAFLRVDDDDAGAAAASCCSLAVAVFAPLPSSSIAALPSCPSPRRDEYGSAGSTDEADDEAPVVTTVVVVVVSMSDSRGVREGRRWWWRWWCCRHVAKWCGTASCSDESLGENGSAGVRTSRDGCCHDAAAALPHGRLSGADAREAPSWGNADEAGVLASVGKRGAPSSSPSSVVCVVK